MRKGQGGLTQAADRLRLRRLLSQAAARARLGLWQEVIDIMKEQITAQSEALVVRQKAWEDRQKALEERRSAMDEWQEKLAAEREAAIAAYQSALGDLEEKKEQALGALGVAPGSKSARRRRRPPSRSQPAKSGSKAAR
jgi:hypothetical protein